MSAVHTTCAPVLVNAQFDGASQSASGVLHMHGQYYEFEAKLEFVMPSAMDFIPEVPLPIELMNELAQSEQSHQLRAFGYNSAEGSCRYFILRELERLSRVQRGQSALIPEDVWQLLCEAHSAEGGPLDNQLTYAWSKVFSEQWWQLKKQLESV